MRAEKHVIAHAPCAITLEQVAAVKEAHTALAAVWSCCFRCALRRRTYTYEKRLRKDCWAPVCQAVVINSQKVTATPRTQAFYATRTHGGVLTNLAVHDLDILRWLGGDLTVTAAATQRHGLTEHPDFEDAGLVHCTLQTAAWCSRVQLARAGRG